MLYTGQTHKELNAPTRDYAQMWVIMRYPTKNTKVAGEWHPELAPSQELFAVFQKLKDEHNWGKDAFEKIYVPAFLKELAENPNVHKSLAYLYEHAQTEDIVLLCSCYQESLCHRSIVRKLVEGAVAVTQGKPDESGYFTRYQALVHARA